jgi:hypothetical protein
MVCVVCLIRLCLLENRGVVSQVMGDGQLHNPRWLWHKILWLRAHTALNLPRGVTFRNVGHPDPSGVTLTVVLH